MTTRILAAGIGLLAALLAPVGTAMATDANAASAAGNQLLQLNQWDWKQATEAPRQQHLQRDRMRPAEQRQSEQLRQQASEQRRDENQLYERQRREQLTTPRAPANPARPVGTTGPQSQQTRALQQQQMQRFKAESNNLRLQQDIQRRASGR